jgi:UDP-glucose 4-epimerase
MKYLVTGGAGFIGNHLTRRLVELDHEVVVIDNLLRGNKLDKEILEKITLIQSDVRDRQVVLDAARGCDIIFHFAAVLGVDVVADNPVETMETEVSGMQNVVNSALYHGVKKIIYASTSGVYGKSAIESSVNEEFEVSPSSSYSIAKRYNEIYLKSVYQEKNLQSSSLRFFNVYGPKQDNRMVIPRFFEQGRKNQPITVYGSGNQTRDFTYIDDVIEAIIRVSQIVSGCEIINVSNNYEYSIMELAKKVKQILHSESEIQTISPPASRYDFEVQRRVGSSAKLFSLTGFCPNTSLEDGLKKTYDYIRNQ